MTSLDQDRAARLVDIARWRVVYHHTATDGSTRTETIAWFETSANAAWSEAATQLPPVGYQRPDTVTIERGTFTPLPEGGHGWQSLGPTQHATVSSRGLVAQDLDDPDPAPTPSETTAALTAAGQQPLFDLEPTK